MSNPLSLAFLLKWDQMQELVVEIQGAKTSSIAFMRILLTQHQPNFPWASSKKSSTNTSMYWRGVRLPLLGEQGSWGICGISWDGLQREGLSSSWLWAMVSKKCGSGSPGWQIWALARSALVSVSARKAGGEFTHPIGSTKGKATSGSLLSFVGNMTPNFGMLSKFSWIW